MLYSMGVGVSISIAIGIAIRICIIIDIGSNVTVLVLILEETSSLMSWLKSYSLSSLVSRTTKVHLTVVSPNEGTFDGPFASQNVWTFRHLQKIWVDMSRDSWIWLDRVPQAMKWPHRNLFLLWGLAWLPSGWVLSVSFNFYDSRRLHYHNYICKGFFSCFLALVVTTF